MNRFDIFGIGNALVDCEYRVDDEFLHRYGVIKSRMTLVDEPRMLELLDAVRELDESRSSGGSAANTVYAASGLGCRGFFLGSVQDDDAGQFFVRDLRDANIATQTSRVQSSSMTGRCLVLVTADGERSMNSHLAISDELEPNMVDEAALSQSSWLYIEGYLASSSACSGTATHARDIARRHGIRTSITLSDPSIINNFRPALREMIGESVDLVFCNLDEAYAWAETDHLEDAVRVLHESARTVVVTDGDKGCYVSSSEGVTHVPGFPVSQLDANGAGDVFAGAFLVKLIKGGNLVGCARFANYLASRAVLNYGARLPTFESYAAHEADYLELHGGK